MLNIFFGEMEEAIYDTNVYFNNTYKDRWIISELAKNVIRDVDKSEVIDSKTIKSPIFGTMSPKRLSGGTKTIMLVAFDKSDNVYNASTCGDNCAKWLLKIAEKNKVTINLNHLMDFGKKTFKVKVLNTGKIVHNMAELVSEAGRFV